MIYNNAWAFEFHGQDFDELHFGVISDRRHGAWSLAARANRSKIKIIIERCFSLPESRVVLCCVVVVD